MKAVVIREFGGPEVLGLETVPDPEPGPGEVVVRVHSVSVNRTFDLAVRRDGNNRNPAMPLVLGADPAGIVAGLGPDVTGVSVGDRVAVLSTMRCGECRRCRLGDNAACARPRMLGIHRWGGYAEYVAAPAANLVPVPSDLSFAEATVITRHAPAAFNLLDDKAELQPGEWVLVMGASGGLGSCCVQVARLRGAHVIAGAGADDRVAAAMRLGAEHGINYRSHDLAAGVMALTDGEGVEVVCENIADPTLWDGAFDSLAQSGRLVTMGAHGGGKVTLDVRRLYGKRLRLIGAAGVTPKNVADAMAAAAAGQIEAVVDRALPLAEAAEAHRLLEAGDIVGKIILDPTL